MVKRFLTDFVPFCICPFKTSRGVIDATGFLFALVCCSLYTDCMDTNEQDISKTEVATKTKLGIGVKVLLTVIILGAVAAGVYASIALSR